LGWFPLSNGAEYSRPCIRCKTYPLHEASFETWREQDLFGKTLAKPAFAARFAAAFFHRPVVLLEQHNNQL
jgi:hypothetical protein